MVAITMPGYMVGSDASTGATQAGGTDWSQPVTVSAADLAQGAQGKITPPDVPTDADFSFKDVLDIFNPLQHIPVVGTIYRAVTGDTMKDSAKIVGDTIYTAPFGPIGFLASVATVMFTQANGGDSPEDMMLAAVGLDGNKNKDIQLAQGTGTASSGTGTASGNTASAGAAQGGQTNSAAMTVAAANSGIVIRAPGTPGMISAGTVASAAAVAAPSASALSASAAAVDDNDDGDDDSGDEMADDTDATAPAATTMAQAAQQAPAAPAVAAPAPMPAVAQATPPAAAIKTAAVSSPAKPKPVAAATAASAATDPTALLLQEAFGPNAANSKLDPSMIDAAMNYGLKQYQAMDRLSPAAALMPVTP